jgi:hypothetical protein
MNHISTEVNEVADELYEGKLIRDGKVGVLYSPGFGAGWSTWTDDYGSAIIFDPMMVGLVEQDKFDELKTYVTLKYPDAYQGGMSDLKVAWIPVGTMFKIREYDGSESIEYKEADGWMIA